MGGGGEHAGVVGGAGLVLGGEPDSMEGPGSATRDAGGSEEDLSAPPVSRIAAALLDIVPLRASVEQLAINTGCVEWVIDRLRTARDLDMSRGTRTAALADVEELFEHLSLIVCGTQEEAPSTEHVPIVKTDTLDEAFDKWLPQLLQIDSKKLEQVPPRKLFWQSKAFPCPFPARMCSGVR